VTLPTTQALAEHAAALRENSIEVARLRAAYRASLPQYLDDKALRARYSFSDNKHLRAELEHHQIPTVPKGRGFKVHIDDVLRLDAICRDEVAHT
jgi:hypothetical protein